MYPWYPIPIIPDEIKNSVIDFVFDRRVHNFNVMYYIGNSNIHGKGVFAKDDIPQGTMLGKITDPYPTLTELGKYLNHSNEANAHGMYTSDSEHNLITTENIRRDTEITLNYSTMPGFQEPNPEWDNKIDMEMGGEGEDILDYDPDMELEEDRGVVKEIAEDGTSEDVIDMETNMKELDEMFIK